MNKKKEESGIATLTPPVTNGERVIKKSTAYTIRPYIDPTVFNMGLEKYEQVLFDGAQQTEDLTAVTINGVKRWLNGMDEFAPEIRGIANPEEKAAKIKNIRTTVAYLEQQINYNKIDIDDSDFWTNVKLFHPTNDSYWSQIKITVKNNEIILDETIPEDLILISCIKAGGFSLIAKSLEDARSSAQQYKFYLDAPDESSAHKTEDRKIKNKALALLQDLFDKNPDKLWYVAKVVDGDSHKYKKDTPNDVVYDLMDTFINGKGIERSITKASKTFIEMSDKNLAYLKTKGVCRDANFYKIIAPKPDGNLYHHNSGTLIGKNLEDCVEYFNNPLNAKIWDLVFDEVKKHWN